MEESFEIKRTGGKPKGRIKKGPASRSSGPSIPSRYQTILNVGRPESTGFGSGSYRFNSSATEGPGPGQYDLSGRMAGDNPSHSVGGFGAMASKTRRGGPRTRKRAPGPGQYDVKVKGRKELLTVGPTSSFAPRLYDHDPAQHAIPGPGDYDPSIDSLSSTRKLQSVVSLKAKSERDGPKKQDFAVPGPGYYETPTISTAAKGTRILAAASARLPASSALDVPGPGAYENPVSIAASLQKSIVRRSQVMGNGTISAVDTPQYRRAQKIRERTAIQKAQLATAPRLDMNGRLVTEPPVPESRKKGVGMTRGPKIATPPAAAANAPGPAFYSPSRRALGKQSFRLNTGQGWI